MSTELLRIRDWAPGEGEGRVRGDFLGLDWDKLRAMKRARGDWDVQSDASVRHDGKIKAVNVKKGGGRRIVDRDQVYPEKKWLDDDERRGGQLNGKLRGKEQEIVERYVDKGESLLLIAQAYKTTATSIRRLLIRRGVTLRDRSEASEIRWKREKG